MDRTKIKYSFLFSEVQTEFFNFALSTARDLAHKRDCNRDTLRNRVRLSSTPPLKTFVSCPCVTHITRFACCGVPTPPLIVAPVLEGSTTHQLEQCLLQHVSRSRRSCHWCHLSPLIIHPPLFCQSLSRTRPPPFAPAACVRSSAQPECSWGMRRLKSPTRSTPQSGPNAAAEEAAWGASASLTASTPVDN